MTWEEWVNSEYNNESYTINYEDNLVYTEPGGELSVQVASKDEVIAPNTQYTTHNKNSYGGQ